MPEVKISALPDAGALDGTETVPLVQAGVTKKLVTAALATQVELDAEAAARAAADAAHDASTGAHNGTLVRVNEGPLSLRDSRVNAPTDGTDASAAIDTAKSLLPGGVGEIFAPPGTFSLSAGVTIGPGILFGGAGRFATIFRAIADITPLTVVPGASNGKAGIEHLQVMAGVATTKPGIQVGDGVGLVSNWHVSDVYAIRGGAGLQFDSGIKLLGALSGSIVNALIDRVTTAGIHASAAAGSGPNAIRISDSNIANSGTYGIYAGGSLGNFVVARTSLQGAIANGVYLDDCDSAAIDDVYFENTGAGTTSINLANGSVGTAITGGRYDAATDKAIVIAATSGATTIMGAELAGALRHIENNSTSSLTVLGGSLDSTKCVGLTNARSVILGAREIAAVAGLVAQGDTISRVQRLNVVELLGALSAVTLKGASTIEAAASLLLGDGAKLRGTKAGVGSFDMLYSDANDVRFGDQQARGLGVALYANSEQVLRGVAAPADGETAVLVRRNVGGVLSLQRVSMGAADSGGVGFKVLRVSN